jgi:hypothetical protein
MNKKIIVLSVFLLMSSVVAIVQVNVYVSTSLDGRIPYFNIPGEVDDTPQSFLVVWENTGSIGCGFRLRADVYELVGNKTRQAYTSWSEEKSIEPGGHEELTAYWYPKGSGNFTVRTFLYYCNSIEDGPRANFTVFRSNITAGEMPFEVKTETTENYVEFRFNSREDVRDLIIIPRRYPVGWVFDSKKVDWIGKGKEKIVKVDYEAGIWGEKNISFDMVTSDGEYYQSTEVTLRKKKEFPIYQAIIGILVVVNLILSIIIIRGGVRFGNREDSDGDFRS